MPKYDKAAYVAMDEDKQKSAVNSGSIVNALMKYSGGKKKSAAKGKAKGIAGKTKKIQYRVS